MVRRPPNSKRPVPLLPYSALFRSVRPRGGRPRAASARPRRSSPATPSAKNRSRRRLAALRAALAHGGGVPLLGLLLAGRLAEAAGDGGTPHQADEQIGRAHV